MTLSFLPSFLPSFPFSFQEKKRARQKEKKKDLLLYHCVGNTCKAERARYLPDEQRGSLIGQKLAYFQLLGMQIGQYLPLGQ